MNDTTLPLLPLKAPGHRSPFGVRRLWKLEIPQETVLLNRTPSQYGMIAKQSMNAKRATRFEKLAKRWKEETLFSSSVSEIVSHPAYVKIIAMGKPALPLIFDEMRRERGHWFWALKAIASVDPVLAKDRGDVEKMTRVWLDWAAEHGFA